MRVVVLAALLLAGCSDRSTEQKRRDMFTLCTQNGGNPIDCATAIQMLGETGDKP